MVSFKQFRLRHTVKFLLLIQQNVRVKTFVMTLCYADPHKLHFWYFKLQKLLIIDRKNLWAPCVIIVWLHFSHFLVLVQWCVCVRACRLRTLKCNTICVYCKLYTVKVLVKFVAIYYGVYVGLCLCWTDLICFEREIPAHGWIPNYMFSET